METTYYTLHTADSAAGVAQACGGSRQLMFLRCPAPKKAPHREDNVLSLDEYRARLSANAAWAEEWDEPSAETAAPRPRTDHSRDWLRLLEIAATIALIAAALSACAAFLC